VSEGNLIPYYHEFLADTLTPVGGYLKICGNSPSFLLESAEGGEKWGRYSFIGVSPLYQITYREKVLTIEGKNSYREVKTSPDPLVELREFMGKLKFTKSEDLPRFQGGLVGYFSYDMVRCWEKLPELAVRDIPFPEAMFIIPESLIIFDHATHKVKVLTFIDLRETDLPEGKKQAEERTEEIMSTLLEKDVPASPDISLSSLESNFERSHFEEAVRKAKKYIYQGDIIQTVISQRWEGKFAGSPFAIYRALRSINPSPYMFYLDFGQVKLLGASPEVLVRMENNLIEVRPIAGTRKRGRNEEKDKELEKELLSDEKEKAEHIMLVDLARNDVGRVAEGGSVKVTELMGIERYSHVMHIVSHVVGKLQKGKDGFDVLRAAFPAGTVSGAPKVRAMEIIEELEPSRRGPYAGAVGYFDFAGNLDFCITIRSIMVYQNRLFVQTGAGIVADSIPEKEYEETVNKARALLAAIDWSKNGLK
ncbi:MAG: anthranilate synthase component I, partial [Caldiserica bacterium]|nr:anthranilate synthase component I [Caldisericota bacterium]